MPIRKGRLHKTCIRCQETFCPTSSNCRVCDKCNINNIKKSKRTNLCYTYAKKN